MNKPANQNRKEFEREAELAIVLAVSNLRAETGLANSTAVPEAAETRLRGSVGPDVSTIELRRQVAAAIQRLQADGFLYAPSDPSKCWSLIPGGARE